MSSDNMPTHEKYPQPVESFWQRLWNRLTAPAKSLRDIGEQREARLASSFLLAIATLDFIGGLARMPRMGIMDSFTGPIGYSFIAILLAYFLSRTNWYRAAVFLFSFFFSALAYISILNQGNQADFGTLILIYVPLSLIVASSFVSAPAIFLLVGLNVGAYLSLPAFGITLPENIGAQTGILTVIGVVLMLLTNFRNNTEKIRLEEAKGINRELEALSGDLEKRVNERTAELAIISEQATKRADQLNVVADLSRSLTSLTNPETLFQRTTKLVSQRMGFYHTGIFLLDEAGEYAALEAANSEGGQKMLSRGHRLRVGSEGIVGFATARGEARIALDVGADAVYFDNPDLPETRSEVALPLNYGGKVIGALDIQSTKPNAFSDEDVAVFTVLADQLAIAIQNARSLERAHAAVAEAEATSRLMVGQTWSNIQRFAPVVGYRYNGNKSEPLTQPTNGEQVESQKATYSVPVQLRGTTIGNMHIMSSSVGHQWTEDEIAIIRATADRVALAAENARLVLESQKRAAKEQVIGEISSKIGAAINLDNILQTTLREMGRILPGADISIQVENK